MATKKPKGLGLGLEALLGPQADDPLRPAAKPAALKLDQLQAGRLDLETYDRLAAAAGFEPCERWASWSCDPFVPDGATYAVSVHRRPTA